MRLKIILGEKGDSLNINRDYRRYFISFIKSAFTKSEKFDKLYSYKKLKPFTFSVFLGDKFEIIDDGEDEKIKINPPFNLIFSTGDPEIFANFYNGVLQMKKENSGVKIGNILFPVKDIIFIDKKVKINTDCAVFKTIGICILTNPAESKKNFERWFIVPKKDNLQEFNEILEKMMLKKYEIINKEKIKTKIELIPLDNESIKEIYVKHYNGFLKGFKGIFLLKSHPDMLQFIYDYGLGIRTGQGFGMVDILKECENK